MDGSTDLQHCLVLRDGSQTAEADGQDSSGLVGGNHGHVDATDAHVLVTGVGPRCVRVMVMVRVCVRFRVRVTVRVRLYRADPPLEP